MAAAEFPKTEADFAEDPRVSFDTTTQRHILETTDGKEYEWNAIYSRWVETVDEELVRAQQSTYGPVVEEPEEDAKAAGKKRKNDDKPSLDNKKAKKEPVERVNSSVYVTGLPLDATFDDIHEGFKKYGLIANNIDSETPRIKMYANDDGSFKGEALITYFRPESVQQAVYLLDGTDFRSGLDGSLRVQEADMSFKKSKEYQDPTSRPKRSKKDVEKIKRMTNAMNARLADWDDDDPQTLELDVKPGSKFDKVVIVKHMFTLEGLKAEPELIVELPEDIREQSRDEEWGDVAAVDVYDLEPEGIVRIRFRDADSASRAVMRMDGRFFDGRQLSAYIPDKKEKFQKSRRDEDEEMKRLEQYGQELEEEDETPAAAAAGNGDA